MICQYYLLINEHGTKTKQWVIVANGRAFPEVLTHRIVAKRMAMHLSRGTLMRSDMGELLRKEAWEKAESEIILEIRRSISVEKGNCPVGKMWNGFEDVGFRACLRCSHLQEDRNRPPDPMIPMRWECGAVLRQVQVARKIGE